MLISCVAYEDGKKLADIGRKISATMSAGLNVLSGSRCTSPTAEELAEMQREFGLHELAVEDAQHGHQRPKIEEYGDSLFAVLHTVEIVDDELQIGEVDIFVGRNYVLSVRSRTKQRVRRTCANAASASPSCSSRARVSSCMRSWTRSSTATFPCWTALEIELEKVEEKMFAGVTDSRFNIEALYQLKQKLMTLKHAVGPLLEATGKLWGGRVPRLCARTQEYFRDVYDHLFRINQSIDSLRDMVVTAVSVNLSLTAVQENETTKRLAAYAALVAVPTMIAGIYGMNFEHMPELKSVYGYPLTVAAMAAIDVYLYFRFRKSGWL